MNSEIKKYALKLLKRQDYCSFRLKKKLCLRFPNFKKEIDYVLKELEAKKFINDNKYLDNKIEYYILHYKGYYLIEDRLLKYGYDKNIINQHFTNYKDMEKEYLNKYINKNIKISKDTLLKKISMHGYDIELANRLLNCDIIK